MQKMIAVAALAALASSARATAQSTGDVAARIALTQTPVGALPPIATSTVKAEVQNGVVLSLRYGYLAGSGGAASMNNFGATAVLPVSLGTTFSLTGGVLGCSGCGTGLTLGIGGDTKLGELPFGSGSDGSRLIFTLNGDFGYGQPSGATFSHGSVLSGAVGLPISLVAGRRTAGDMLFVPFITPGFGFGEIRSERIDVGGIVSEDSPSGSRFMLGGGLGLYNRSSSVGFDFGFQYVPIQQGQVLIGVGLSLGGR